jgi:hypothetical protein
MPTKSPSHITDNKDEGDLRAIQCLKESVSSGKHWYLALLEAIRLWKSAEETYKGRRYCYLIDGEAFDWLLLAERLCNEIGDLIPEKERINLLFFGRPPIDLANEEFKKLIGAAKYRAYLNYLYGVLVEEALILAVGDEVRKERRAVGWDKYDNVLDKAYNRIYEQNQQVLFDSFRKEKKYSKRKAVSLGMLKEFTYWLFKYRLKHCDKSRVASDTKKALLYMQRNLALKKQSSYSS